MAVEIGVHQLCADWSALLPDVEARCRRAAKAALSVVGGDGAVSLVLVDDSHIRRLNATYRGIDKATNVLAFPCGEAVPDGAGEVELGDVFVAYETAVSEAGGADAADAAADHLSHLVVHGVLHLLGHDHETAAEAGVMEALEIEVLAGLGIPNPYESAAA